MSQGTPINKLGGNSMNSEDSRLVDSILNDLNNPQQGSQQAPQQAPQQGSQQGPQLPQSGSPPQQMNAEQHRALLAQRQQAMMQQQMMMQQQAMQQQMKKNDSESILDKLQAKWKEILLVVLICLLINVPMIDNLFRSGGTTFFITESGDLNTQAIIVKAISAGICYFIGSTFIPLN